MKHPRYPTRAHFRTRRSSAEPSGPICADPLGLTTLDRPLVEWPIAAPRRPEPPRRPARLRARVAWVAIALTLAASSAMGVAAGALLALTR